MKKVLALAIVLLLVPLTVSAQEIWEPTPGTSWQIQLSGTIDTSYDVAMYDIDLFDTPEATIDQLHNAGRTVICYFSAGSWEGWRPDYGDFPPEVLGNTVDRLPDEKWLDIRQLDLLDPIMSARLDLAVSKGCDGVDTGKVDGYTNITGFPLSAADQITYNTWLATEAHNRNLSIGLRNDLNQVNELLHHFDWAINEECFLYNECELLLPFISAGKAVFNIEYQGSPVIYCPQAFSMGFSTLTKSSDLGDEPPNACDIDADGIPDSDDNCPENSNPDQNDTDGDEIGDTCDNCPNGIDDDFDRDNICIDVDNCPATPNQDQLDESPPGGNNCGDACECEGNFDDDQDQDGSDAATFKVDFGRSAFFKPVYQ